MEVVTTKMKGRMKAWRTKTMKDNEKKWNEYLEKDKNRNKINRAKQRERLKTNHDLLLEKRRKDKERQALCRKRKKEKMLAVPESKPSDKQLGTYKSPRTLGKAIKKVKQVLPKSPGKKQAVVRHLVESTFRQQLAKDLFRSKKSGSKKLTEECKEAVIKFYNCDEISRQAPGKRDVKSVKDKTTGKRSLKQTRHMVIGINEAYEEFKKVHPEQKVSRSKFYELRPTNILPVSKMPHSVCVCRYHVNFTFLLETLSKNEGNIAPTHKELLPIICCDEENESCMFNKCEKCIYDIRGVLNKDCNVNKQVKWKQWVNDDKNHANLVENLGTLDDVITELNSQLKYFKTHTFIKRRQSQYFDEAKKALNDNPERIVMQVDFAENYSLVEQDEIQSAHWSHNQVSIFTSCVWQLDKVYSFAVVSDELEHSKYSVWTFMKELLKQVKILIPNAEEVFLFSDNYAGQFKSRYSVSNICYSEDDFAIPISEWNFFAASQHGKGAVDGVGGCVKRAVWKAVQGRQTIVSTAEDFYNVTTAKCHDIKTLYVPKENVKACIPLLDKRWGKLSEIVGIRSMHHFRVYDKDNLLISKYSGTEMEKISIIYKPKKSKSHINKKRLRYSDVYSDSSEDDLAGDGIEDESDREALFNHENLLTPPTKKTVVPGTYILVQFTSDKGSIFKYVGICQTMVRNDDEVAVVFLKCYGKMKHQFVSNETDESIISFKDILFIVREPSVKVAGNTVIYEFGGVLDVSG